MTAPIRVYHVHRLWWWACRPCYFGRRPRWWGPDQLSLAEAADAGRQHLREVHGG